jgi:hypothetical protein
MLMLVLLPTLVALFGTAVFAVVAIRFRKSVRTLAVAALLPFGTEAEAKRLARAMQCRMLLAVVLGIVVATAVALIPIDHVRTAVAIAPGIGGAAALLVIAISPFPRRAPEDGLRRADLVPRGMATFGPRWGFILPLIAAALLVVLLIVTGVTASPDGDGRMRTLLVYIPQEDLSGHVHFGGFYGDVYPGWFYGGPILIAVALLILVLLAALSRVALAPKIGSADGAALDRLLRAAMTRFVMLFGSAVIVLYLGAVALTAGESARDSSQWEHPTAAFQRIIDAKTKAAGTNSFSYTMTPKDMVHGVVQPTYTVGAVGAVLGIILIGVAIVLTLLALTSLVVRWRVAPAVERESVDA